MILFFVSPSEPTASREPIFDRIIFIVEILVFFSVGKPLRVLGGLQVLSSSLDYGEAQRSGLGPSFLAMVMEWKDDEVRVAGKCWEGKLWDWELKNGWAWMLDKHGFRFSPDEILGIGSTSESACLLKVYTLLRYPEKQGKYQKLTPEFLLKYLVCLSILWNVKTYPWVLGYFYQWPPNYLRCFRLAPCIKN